MTKSVGVASADVDITPAVEDPFKRHRIDLAAVESGKWVEVEGDRWLVRKWGAKAAGEARSAVMQANGMAEDAPVPPHLHRAVLGAMFAASIVACKLKGDPARRYDTQLGERVYHDPELVEYRDKLMDCMAGDFRKEAVAAAAILGN